MLFLRDSVITLTVDGQPDLILRYSNDEVDSIVATKEVRIEELRVFTIPSSPNGPVGRPLVCDLHVLSRFSWSLDVSVMEECRCKGLRGYTWRELA